MNRRQALPALLALCGTPLAWGQGVKRVTVGVLIAFPQTDEVMRPRLAAFADGLQKLGWREGQNLLLEVRHGRNAAEMQRQAGELAALNPAVMLVQTNLAVAAVRQQLTVPTVFVAVSDPVGSGFVASLARPGGNMTGFANFAPEMGAKWLQVLREISPRLERIVLLLNPAIAANRDLGHSAASAAEAAGIGATTVTSGDDAALESAILNFIGKRRGGIIVFPNPANTAHQKQIIEIAARHKLPAIYPFEYYAKNGGLVAYGIDLKEQFRLAAEYVDRILRGAKPADLPVQQPDKYELIINQRTARALQLSVPGTLLARADEVIQ